MKNLRFMGLGLVILVQALVAGSLIWKHERVMREGEVFLFLTRPIDPADPFQGRYVRLVYQNTYIPGKENDPAPERCEKVYVEVRADEDGFAIFSSWHREPQPGMTTLKLRYRGARTRWNRETKTSQHLGLNFTVPFSRFYMEENKAPRAEKRVREETRNTNCCAAVRILDGTALIEDLYVNGVSVHELMDEPAP